MASCQSIWHNACFYSLVPGEVCTRRAAGHGAVLRVFRFKQGANFSIPGPKQNELVLKARCAISVVLSVKQGHNIDCLNLEQSSKMDGFCFKLGRRSKVVVSSPPPKGPEVDLFSLRC